MAEPATTAWEFQNLIGGGIAACGLNRFGHIQIFMVAIYANLQRIFEMAIGFAVEHKLLPLESSIFYGWDTMLSEEGIEVGPALWSPAAWPDFWIMVVGPLVGALLAAITWKGILAASHEGAQ